MDTGVKTMITNEQPGFKKRKGNRKPVIIETLPKKEDRKPIY